MWNQEFYIKIDDDHNTVGYPILKSNLHYIPNIDVENLPPDIVRLEKAEPRIKDLFEVDMGVSYQYDNGIVREVINYRDMTHDEMNETIEKIKTEFYEVTGYNSWNFSMEDKVMMPPIPYPGSEDSIYVYEWNEPNVRWDQSLREPESAN